jgi:carbonic anhydrase
VGLWHKIQDDSDWAAKPRMPARFLSLFRNPVTRRELEVDKYHLYLDGPLVCFNMFHMIRELGNRPHDVREVCLHLSERVPLVDHTTYDTLHNFMDEFGASADHPNLVIDGWDHLRPLSKHETSGRIALNAAKRLDTTAEAEAELRAAQATD